MHVFELSLESTSCSIAEQTCPQVQQKSSSPLPCSYLYQLHYYCYNYCQYGTRVVDYHQSFPAIPIC